MQSPRSMSSVRGTTEVATKASSVVGVVASCSEGTKTSGTEGVVMAVVEMETDSETEVPPSIRGSVSFF